MAEVKLLGAFPSPFSYRVEWALKLKGIEYDYSEQNLQNKSPLLLQSNPVYKKIPVLIHAGKPITESQLIIQYIDETWKENPLLPEDPYGRAIDRFWAKFGDEKCVPAMFKFLLSVGKEQEKAIEEVIESLKTVEEHGLKGKKRFFAGERVGLADLVFGFIACWMVVFEEIVEINVMDVKSFPCLHAWMHNFLEEAVIKENLPSREGILAYFKGRRESFLASVAT